MLRSLVLSFLLLALLPPTLFAAETKESVSKSDISIGTLKKESSANRNNLKAKDTADGAIKKAAPVPQEEDPQVNAATIGKLRQEMSTHQEKIEQSGQQEHSILDELAALDATIAKKKGAIDNLRVRIREQQRLLAAKEEELAGVTRNNEALRQHLIKRLQAFYFFGKTGFLTVAFSSKTVPDLMLLNDGFQSLVSYDQAIFAGYRRSVQDIERVKQAQEREQTVHEHLLAEADKENNLLQQAAEEKNAVLRRIRTEKGLYEQALREMKKAESSLLATLASANQKSEKKAIGFVAQKKKLPPPVWGKLLHRFHDPVAPDTDTTFTNGITIGAPDNAEVLAVYGGMVIFAGYMTGYGKVVIIEHEQDYYTVTARFDEIRVQEGAVVKQNQILGTTGELSSLFGQGLYFEIRHGAEPENPLEWLQPGTLANR